MSHPDTRPSLLVRLQNHQDKVAWDEFVEVYQPVLVRVAQSKGLQDADAQDLAQHVLISVSKAIHRFDPDRPGARFRTWLRRIADNAIINAVTRRPADLGVGGELYSTSTIACDANSKLIRTEFRREIFRMAANSIRHDFSDAIWSAFWQTSVENRSVEEVALEMKKSVGSVYAARSRVMRRLRCRVQELLEEHE
ncbi:MAG: sigma-70 family RNA polymerase sigma factor [Planctomycetota bacterium]